MAVLASNSSANFTSSGTWSLVDSTSFLDSETGTTNSTTSFVSSSTFTPGAITIDGIGLKISSRSGAPTGTFSVRLFNSTLAAAVAGTTVTVNVTDINQTAGGWYFFKFSSSVLLLVATNYTVQITSSTNAQVTLFRDSTAANWSRYLRTTTTQAPAAADQLIVAGDFLSAGSSTSYTVTMDNTATTSFGQIDIANKGTLEYGVTGSTNYYLKVAGDIHIHDGATFNLGTSGSPMPSTSTGKLEFDCSSNVQFGMEVAPGGTLNAYGNAITNVSALLASDASAAATSLTTNISTGWLSGDNIAIASTTRTATEGENKTLTANASGTTLTINAITNAHSGTSPTQAELINLTRNVQIFGTSTSNQGYILNQNTSTVTMSDVEIYNMGSATASKRGVDIATTTGSFSATRCSFHDFAVTGSRVFCNSATNNNITFSYCVFYLIANESLITTATSGTNNSISNCIAIKNTTASTPLFSFNDLGGTISNNTAASATGNGFTLSDTGAYTGTISGNTAHSNNAIGFSYTNVTSTTSMSGQSGGTFTTWRNNTYGISFANSFNFTVDTVTAFGNLTGNQNISSHCAGIVFRNLTYNAGTTLTCPVGVNLSADHSNIIYDTCTFGATTTHATADINIPASNTYVDSLFRNCLFSSSTEFSNTSTNMVGTSMIRSARHDQTAGNHKLIRRVGTNSSDSTIFNTATPSLRLTPNSSTQKLQSNRFKFAVRSGSTAVVSIAIRKSVVGDGAAYNGNQPRLMLASNGAVGVTSDTVLATSTNAANGAFETLTATTSAITDDASFYVFVDCDGTTGWINVEDIRVESS